jgi:hypothetical protein
MMPVFSGWRCCQSNYEPRFDLAHHPLKCEGGKMMALVNDNVPIFGHKVLDFSLAMQALNNRYVDVSGPFRFAAADLADLVDWDFEEHGKPLPPLVEQLLAVHYH